MTWLEKLILAGLIFLLGTSTGYWWRMVQVESIHKVEVAELKKLNSELVEIYIDFETRLRKLEGKRGIKY